MSLDTFLIFAAVAVSTALAAVPFLGKTRTIAGWSFSAGMAALAAQSIFDGLSLMGTDPQTVVYRETLALGAKSCLPVTWICFSLVYSRGNYPEFLRRWRLPLVVAALLPVVWLTFWLSGVGMIDLRPPDNAANAWRTVYSSASRGLIALLLVSGVLVLANLEKTFRSAVGATQWRIKFMVFGLWLIFGARIFTESQALLFNGHNLTLPIIDAGALLTGCLLITLVYVRHGLGEIDVYPSRAVLQSSVTVFLAGGYLFIVGTLAQIAARLGSARGFQAQVLVVLLGIVVLIVMIFSDRLRQRVGQFVSRHFRRPQHDSRVVWTQLTRQLSDARDEASLSTVAARFLSETFRALSVTLWVADERRDRLRFAASTSPLARAAAGSTDGEIAVEGLAGSFFSGQPAAGRTFSLEKDRSDWAEALRRANPRQFAASGERLCVPLTTGERCLGVAVLGDRVNSVPYTGEEIDLLECIRDHLTAALLNLRLTGDLMQAKEMEAFQTMSTFFVHDLKNAAYSLGLMLENLPVHFDDPEFRADALRGVGSTVGRINHLIERLGTLRRKPEAYPAPLDLNRLVQETLDALPAAPAGVTLHRELAPLPTVHADREQIESVLTNLVLNARDALEPRGGEIRVRTGTQGGRAEFSVSDNGCGMSAEFLRGSLFRPFHTTKKKGLGIGMFQSKMIVEANRGSLLVESTLGKGTTFRVSLPLAPKE